MGDAISDAMAAQFQSVTGIDVSGSSGGSGSGLGGTVGAAAGAAAGSAILPGVGTVIGGAIGGSIGGWVSSTFGSGPCGDPDPGDWASWCAQHMPQGGNPGGGCFDSWGWGDCPPQPANVDASAPPPPPPPPPPATVVSAGWAGRQLVDPATLSLAQKVKDVAACAAAGNPACQSQLPVLQNQLLQQSISANTLKLTAVASPKHPLLMAAKKPSIGLTGSLSTTDLLLFAAVAAAAIVAKKKGMI
jgi:hypothetical protein